jgi:hypothetical protein
MRWKSEDLQKDKRGYLDEEAKRNIFKDIAVTIIDFIKENADLREKLEEFMKMSELHIDTAKNWISYEHSHLLE